MFEVMFSGVGRMRVNLLFDQLFSRVDDTLLAGTKFEKCREWFGFSLNIIVFLFVFCF